MHTAQRTGPEITGEQIAKLIVGSRVAMQAKLYALIQVSLALIHGRPACSGHLKSPDATPPLARSEQARV